MCQHDDRDTYRPEQRRRRPGGMAASLSSVCFNQSPCLTGAVQGMSRMDATQHPGEQLQIMAGLNRVDMTGSQRTSTASRISQTVAATETVAHLTPTPAGPGTLDGHRQALPTCCSQAANERGLAGRLHQG